MTLDQLLGDDAMIGRMDDAQFDQYWTALGQVIRLAARHKAEPGPAVQDRQEMSCTSASTERRPSWDFEPSAVPATFGFGRR